jgi:hypothetical protein
MIDLSNIKLEAVPKEAFNPGFNNLLSTVFGESTSGSTPGKKSELEKDMDK